MFPTRTNPPHVPFEEWDEPVWDPAVHLAKDLPTGVMVFGEGDKSHTFEPHDLPCPPPAKRGMRSRLAYSQPFQLLTEEGVAALRKVVDYNTKHKMVGAPDGRIPVSVRQMGYRSRFIRDMNQCPEMREKLSMIAGVQIVPSVMETTWGHTNIGVIGDGQPVDQWHIDSVPFVLVILASDMTGAVGGDLEVVRRAPYQAAFDRIRETDNQVPKDELLVANYESAGCAILMQGSHMVHHVTPVLKAKERRITVINSYQCADPYYPDDTRLDFFKYDTDSAYFQYTRHRALRIRNRMNEFLSQEEWESDPIKLAKVLKDASLDLQDGVDVLTGLKDDSVPYFQEKSKNVEIATKDLEKKDSTGVDGAELVDISSNFPIQAKSKL